MRRPASLTYSGTKSGELRPMKSPLFSTIAATVRSSSSTRLRSEMSRK